MANEFFTILTATGRNKLANATATATPLNLTQMAVGDGDNGAYYSPTEAQTTLKHEVWRGAINHLAVDANNPNWIVAELVIPDDVGGFYIREVGLFDSAGAMIAVGKFPESYKPTLAAGSNKQLYVRMILEVANTSAVTLLVDPSVVLATRQYCDDKIAAEINRLDGKQSVRVTTTAAIALAGLQNIDGVALSAGDRVLVKDQAAAKDNGVYVAAAGAWSRASDADVVAEMTPGVLISVEQGTANADTVWMLVTDGPITLGTTGLSFDLIGKRGLVTNAEMALALADKVSKPELQSQAHTAFTTAGAAPNFSLTPSPAITAYSANQRFRVKFHAAGTGADVMSVNALGNKNLKQYDSTGAKVAAVITANMLVDVEYDGVDFVLLDRLPLAHGQQKFTANGNFTVPAGITTVYVTLAAGGGGGAGSLSAAPYAGGGGGAGEVKYRVPVAVTPGQVIAVTIGQGGAPGAGSSYGGTYANSNGSAGTASSFGALLTATPGGGGRCQSGEASGGSAGGELSSYGADGGTSENLGGAGGGNFFAAPSFGDYNQLAGVGNLYGGGGAGGRASGYWQSGGAGAAGICIVEW